MSVRASLLAAVIAVLTQPTAQAQTQPGTPGAAPPRPASAAPFALPRAAAAAEAAPPAAARPAGGPFRLERPQPQRQPGVAAPTAGPARIDESALRFYAAQGQMARVAAEIRRLRAAYPGWQPPEDLLVEASERVDEQPLWELYAQGRFEEVRDQIAVLQSQHPTYRPSADLTGNLQRTEVRAAIQHASEGRLWQQVVELAADAPELLVCREMDMLWRVAEALTQMQDTARAIDLYRYILVNCDNPRERLATVQKAMASLDTRSVEQLIAIGRRRSDGSSEFEPVRIDLARRAVGDATRGGSVEPPSERQLRLLETSARTGRSAEDAELLGWYHFSRREYAVSRDWFQASMALAVRPKAAEGLVLAIRNLGELRQAEDLAFEHRALDPLIRRAYIEIVSAQMTGPARGTLEPPRIARAQELIQQEQSALGAQSVGWYLYNRNDLRGARAWFERSVAWTPTEEGALGLGVTAHRLGDRRTFTTVLATYRGQFPAIAAMAGMEAGVPRGVRTAAQRGGNRQAAARRRGGGGEGGGNPTEIRAAVALYESGRYREAAAALERFGGNQNLQQLRGWALVNAGEYNRARDLFTDLDRRRSTRDTRHGQFVAETRVLGNDSRYFPWDR